LSKIYDVVTAFNEIQLYDLRINVLDPFVDFFVINECTKTFSGNNKPLFFQDNKELFKKFKDFINSEDEWFNERWLSRALRRLSLVSFALFFQEYIYLHLLH